MEEIAKDYLDKLINRSLIQVEKRILGKIKTCRVHDLLRGLAIEKTKDLNFLFIYDEINHSNISSIISLLTRGQELETMCRTFSSLRVLDIPSSISQQRKFAKQIGNLIHLKYLELTTNETNLDNSLIFNLRRLQTLVVDGNIANLPYEIRRLQELRHLIRSFKVGLGSSISNFLT
ncbi:hypothetical protein ACOSP7_004719 [Xanthoceras sorbifolium]